MSEIINLDELLGQYNPTDPTTIYPTIEHITEPLTIDELMECEYLTLNDESKSRIITYFSELISTTSESMRNFRDVIINETVKYDIQNNNQIFTNKIIIYGPGYSINWYLFKNNNSLYFIHKNQITGTIGWKKTNFNILTDHT